MATMGLRYVAWGKMATEPSNAVPTYETGLVIGKAVSVNLTISNAEAELYADDLMAEYAKEFSSAALTMEVDHISLQNQATLYGATITNDELQMNPNDNAPYGGIGGYQVLSVGNVRKYRAWFFPKAKASIPDWSGTTKGQNISFGTAPLELKILAPNFGPWYYVKEFTTAAAAQAYIDTKLGVATYHAVNVSMSSASTSDTVSPLGLNYVANAGSLEIIITGTATALYDNGVEKKASIVNGKYTLSNVTAARNIAVIF